LSASVLDNVISRLDSRLEQAVNKLKGDWLKSRQKDKSDSKQKSFLDILEETTAGNSAFENVISEIRSTTGELDENNFREIIEALAEKNKTGQGKEVTGLPRGTFNRNNILFFADKELLKAARYNIPFSVICLAVMKIQPQKKVPPESINSTIVLYNIMDLLSSKVRDTDLLGMLDSSKIIILLPLTSENPAKLAMRRHMQTINSGIFSINEVPMKIQVAGAVTMFDSKKKTNVTDFISTAESRAIDMVQRIRNVQSLY
jgi:GGDEF domain-containing protein